MSKLFLIAGLAAGLLTGSLQAATLIAGRLLADFGNSSVPIGIEIAPDGRRAYVAHANADQISIIDLAEWKKVGALTAGKEPDGMGLSVLEVKKGT